MVRRASSAGVRSSRWRRRLSFEGLESRRLLATLTVNTTADETTPDTTLSLREAIEVVNGTQYFVAKNDFPEAIGPAFWERKTT